MVLLGAAVKVFWLTTCSPEVKQCTPPGLLQYFEEHGVPATGFEYTQPLGLFFCNTPRLARSLTGNAVSQLTIGDPAEIPCACEHEVKGPWLRANGFIPPGRDHVVTCDSGVLQRAPAGLHTLFEHGYKHRPEELSVTMSQQVRHDVVTSLRSGIEKFVNATVPVHRNMGNLPLMVQKICAGIERQLSAHKFRDGQVFTNQSKPHEPGTVFTKWNRAFKRTIQTFQRSYAFTTADKLGKNYVVVCLKLYVALVLQDLNSDGFYLRVLAANDTSVIDKVAAELVQAVNLLAKNMYSNFSAERLLQHMCLLPYAAALVKLHKSPLQFRFLACSSKNGLKVVALWLNALLSSIHRDLVLEWRKLLSRLGVDWRHLPPWYATRSAQVVSLVKHFNQLRMSESEFVRGSGWQGFDVVRLYTNIPQDDLIQSLSALLGELVWDKHSSQRNGPRTRLYQVFKDTTYGAVWWEESDSLADVRTHYGTFAPGRTHGMKNDNWGVDREKGAFYLFHFQGATNVLRLLVKFSYVQFGGMMWHQQTGIPMGINPAVFMANYYLFYYEYRFLAQFLLLMDTHPMVPGADVHASALFESDVTDEADPVWKSQWPADVHADFKGNIAWYVLNQFQLMVRFVDDVTSGPNLFLKHLLNRGNTILGVLIHGIYPDCLALERTDADLWSFPTLDVRILSEVCLIVNREGQVVDCCVVSYTVLFDKRRQSCYDGIPIVQFTHVSSAVSSVVTTSIVYGQLHRFRELIMLRAYYVFECALLLHKLVQCGYKRTVLLGKLKRHLKQFPDTFGDTSYQPLYDAVVLRLADPNLNDHSAP